MALRVLLADESSTIKKVFQLALQDYAVEVKPVALGIDVLAVARDFKPDVIFADILLQKRNGYEVCAELKSDEELKSTPVVLMWSGFMELDRDKFEACGADGRLEKPFDVAQLRKLVQDLVSKTKTQSLADFLDFPDLPEIEDQKVEEAQSSEITFSEDASKEQEEDEFRPVPIPKMSTQSGANEKFRVEAPPDEDDEAEFITQPKMEAQENDEPELDAELIDDDDEDFSFHRPGQQTQSQNTSFSQETKGFDLSSDEIREIVERLAPKIIEEIAWKIVPDLAAQIIEKEIKNLLAEKDKEVSP